MIEVLYAFVLGFAVVGNGVMVVSDTDRKWQWLSLALIFILPVLFIYFSAGPTGSLKAVIISLILSSLGTHLAYFLLGATLAIFVVLYEEGTYAWVRRLIHPESAPTELLKAGQRGQREVRGKPMSSALMGTSTAMFAVQGLDVKTVALVRLALAAFSKVDSRVVVGIEASLKLGDGRRYKAFHQLVSESQSRRQGIKDIIHPYWREINGNHASARNMFTSLCQLARDTRNTDKKTVSRLVTIGQSLGLSPENMGLAINQLRA